MGKESRVSWRTIALYEKAVLVSRFPAYKLEDLDDARVLRNLVHAAQLLDAARKLSE